jgi:hypothetical protein
MISNNNSSIFGITMEPLNMIGIFAFGIFGRTVLKSVLGGAATPVILLSLAGYVYYLKQKERHKLEMNRNNLNHMAKNLGNANRFSSTYGNGMGVATGSSTVNSSFNNKMYTGSSSNNLSSKIGSNTNIRGSSYNLSSTSLNGVSNIRNNNNSFQSSLRELDNTIQNRFGSQSGTIKITKRERRRIQGMYDKKFAQNSNSSKTSNSHSEKQNITHNADDGAVQCTQQENRKERRLYKGRRKRRNRKLTTNIKYAD